MFKGNKPDIGSTRMKIGAIFAAIMAFFAVINLLPIDKPFFLADDSSIRAGPLLAEGRCDEGYAIYEKRAAAERFGFSWQYVGKMKYRGDCRGQDLPGAITAYRKAALKGDCGANFRLAGIALLHPEVPGVAQVTPANNLFAATMCAYHTDDEKLISLFFDKYLLPDFGHLRPLFHEALERRRRFKTLAEDDQQRIVDALVNGNGFDANPDTKP